MENEFDMIKRFTDYLISLGYPKESIVPEYSINKRNRIDIAIIEPKTNILVQIFELKGVFSKNTLDGAKEQLKAYLSELKIAVSAYVVFNGDDSNSFKIFDYYSLKETDIFDYIYSLNNAISIKNKSIEKSKKQKIDFFNYLCFIEVFFLIALVVCKKIFYFDLSWNELSIIGTAVLLSLLPFFYEFSFNGFGFRRKKEENMQK